MRVGYWMQGQAMEWVELEEQRRLETLRCIAFICPHCGEVWARVIVPAREWTVVERDCRGALLSINPDDYRTYYYSPYIYSRLLYVESLPPTWVRREFELELKGNGK